MFGIVAFAYDMGPNRPFRVKGSWVKKHASVKQTEAELKVLVLPVE